MVGLGQWEQFIDWMALNGVNMPLAITGQEAVWQAVGKRFGMTDAELGAFLPGPPYLPFCWMGCLDGRGGPLPSDWIPKHIELEQRILARERELGMTPVLQGFTGHLPKAIADKFPGTNVQKIHWFGFDTWMLDPTDPLFQRLGTAWIEEQTRLFGTNHLYAADSFIEMTPPSGEREYLSKIGAASITAWPTPIRKRYGCSSRGRSLRAICGDSNPFGHQTESKRFWMPFRTIAC